MSQLTDPNFYVEAGERAVKTAAQSALIAFGAEQVDLIAYGKDGLLVVAGLAIGGAVLSLLTSLASLRVGAPGSPSLVD